jgi:hypothetical protein
MDSALRTNWSAHHSLLKNSKPILASPPGLSGKVSIYRAFHIVLRDYKMDLPTDKTIPAW